LQGFATEYFIISIDILKTGLKTGLKAAAAPAPLESKKIRKRAKDRRGRAQRAGSRRTRTLEASSAQSYPIPPVGRGVDN